MREGFKSKAFTEANSRFLLKHAAGFAEEGGNATPFIAWTAVLAKKTTDKQFLQKLEEARKARAYLLKASKFLHGVETPEDHAQVSARLFDHVLETHAKNPRLLEEKRFWQQTELYAKQLKALKTSLKVA